MRKSFKTKRRSCALCKPHKMGWDKRWNPREAALRLAMDKAASYAASVTSATTVSQGTITRSSLSRESRPTRSSARTSVWTFL